MSRSSWSLAAACALLLVAASCSDSPAPMTSPAGGSPSFDVGGVPNAAAQGNPYRHFFAVRASAAAKGGHGGGGGGGGHANTGIFYHGGPVIAFPRVAAIYWSSGTIYSGGPTPATSGAGSADGSMVGLFMRSLGGSPYWNINSTYSDGSGASVANSLAYSGYWADDQNSPESGQSVSDAQVINEVVASFTQNGGPFVYDPSTVYVVFSGAGVNLGGGFGTQYCAYHGRFSWNGNDVKYAVMPYTASFPSGCTAGSNISPTSDFAAAAEVNVLAHESEEAATDEDLNAWYDRRGNENADKCAWMFGTTQSGSTGVYNQTIGGVRWLIQMNWVNAGSGGCLQHWP
jgi:Phosphate-induced protein 1 conserved region